MSSCKYPDMYNIKWNSQSDDASGSMPVGGGDIGANVWVENDELLLYIQRSGIHDEYNGFPKLGRIRLWTEPNVFTECTNFCQELKLREGCIDISSTHVDFGSVQFTIWVEVKSPRIHIECNAGNELTFFLQYESWRTAPRKLSTEDVNKERWGWWDTGGWPHDVILEPDTVIPLDDSILFYHVNPEEKLTSKLAYRNMGLKQHYGEYEDPLKDLVWGGVIGGSGLEFDTTIEGKYDSTAFSGWRYRTSRPTQHMSFHMLFHTSTCDSGEIWKSEIESMRELPTSLEKVWAENIRWWGGFWNRSYILLNPDLDARDPVWCAGRNYNLFRYMTACNAYGANPTMFNGGLFTFDPGLVDRQHSYHPDWRAWSGGNYTLQNQRWVYWPMLKWGDYEHMETHFDFFLRVLDVATLRVSENYGIEGCLFEEVGTVYGLPMPMHYGFEESDNEMRRRPPWIEPGLSSNWCVIHHHTAMLEFSHMILEYHRYSGRDISRWLPIVRGTLDFFDQYYRLKAKYNANFREYGPDGKLILFPSGACESHYYVSNPVPDVAGLTAVVNGAAKLPEEWREAFFRGILERLQRTLPPIHTEQIDGDTVIPPGKSVVYSWWKKTELYINYPMFPFNVIKAGDPEMAYVWNTYKHWETWQTREAWEAHKSWTNGNVAFARMGDAEKAAELTLKTLQDGPFRFPAFWGPGYDWVPDHNWGGTGSVGLQEMLVQTMDDRVVLLPAWPEDWACDFKIHAPLGTVLSGTYSAGYLTYAIIPEQRENDIAVVGAHASSPKA